MLTIYHHYLTEVPLLTFFTIPYVKNNKSQLQVTDTADERLPVGH